MRWDAQRLDLEEPTALPGMPGVRGLLRSIEVPEFPGLTFHEVRAKSALNAVPTGSVMPFPWTINPYRGCSHSCVYCLAGNTRVLMADGSQKVVEDIGVGDRIVGTSRRGADRRYVTTEVLAHWSTVKRAFRITLADGTELVASGDHRFLTGRGWKHVTGAMSGPQQRPYLTTNDEMLGFGRTPKPIMACLSRRAPAPRETRGVRVQDGQSVDRIKALVDWLGGSSVAWERGFLAGIFDAEGSRSGSLRITNADAKFLARTHAAFATFGFESTVEDYGRENGVQAVRLLGGLREQMRFVHLVDPATRRNCSLEGIAVQSDAGLRVTAVEDLGFEMPMYDITTGTGDFVANGVVSHNCFARGTHEWLELDSGRDFDTQIVVKTNLVEVLRKELARPSWQREHVALGTNTDPYQRAEGRYRLMPGVIRALAQSGTPFSILTKGTLLRRDVPLLVEAAREVPVGLGVSMAIEDDDLHASLEPGVPTPRARLDLVRAVTGAGLPCGVFLAPVLPGLTDGVAELDAAIAAIAEAGATGVTVVPLHLRPGARQWFMAWLVREHPDLVPRYERLYAGRAYVPAEYRTWLAQRVAPLLTAHGLNRHRGGAARRVEGGAGAGVPGDGEAEFPEGSLPAGGLPHAGPPNDGPVARPVVPSAARSRGAGPEAEQLTLL